MVDREQTAATALAPSLPARLEHLFGALDESGLRWSLLRPRPQLTMPTGDVDLLVEPADLAEVRRLLSEQGFTTMPVGRKDELHAGDYDPASDRFFWLHVQTALRLGDVAVPAPGVLDAAERDPLPHPSDAWLLWLLLLHGLLDKHVIAERHRFEVMRLARSAPPAPLPLAAIAASRGLDPELLLELACAGDWDRLEGLPIEGAPAAPPLAERISGTIDRVRRLWTRRGLGVAVIGPDGAGKTSLVGVLSDTLWFESQLMYMGLTGGRLPRADALRVPGVVLSARLAIIWVRWGVGLYHRLRGRVVLFDRYVLDGTVPSGAQLTAAARLSRRLQARACPRPDLVLLLDASGETLHERSGEYDAQTLEAWRASYRRLADRMARVELLDAEQPADAVRRDALTLIWRSYHRRWRRRRG